jgi:hypothetical protein
VPVRGERNIQIARNIISCVICATILAIILGMVPFLFLCFEYVAIDKLLPAPLPDPASLNIFLRSSGQNVTLSLCTIRRAFQVHIGFSDSCDQISNSLYPELEHSLTTVETTSSTDTDDLEDFSHGVPLGILTAFAGLVTWLSWVLIAVGALAYFAGVVYFCCQCCCGRSQAKVHDVEMQDAASSSGLVG